MGTIAKQGSFTLNTATGNQTISGLGFTPKLVIFWGNQNPTINGFLESRRFYGAATSSTNQWAMPTSHNPGNGYVSRSIKIDKCMKFQDGFTDVTIMEASFVSMNTDGFTINVTTGVSVTIYYLAIGGSSFSAKASYFDIPNTAANSTVSVTGVGFTPKALMTFTGQQNTLMTPENYTAIDGGDGINIGFACNNGGSTSQMATGQMAQPDTPAAGGYHASASAFVQIGYSSNVLDTQGTVSAWNSDGFSTFFSTKWNGSSVRCCYIALGGTAKFAVGGISEPGATGAQTITTTGVKPVAAIMTSSLVTEYDSNAFVGGALTAFGAAVNANQQTVTTHYHMIGNGNARSAPDTTGFLGRMSSAGTLDAKAALTSQNANGFTLNWTTVSGSANKYSYLIIGEPPATAARMMIGLFN